jgi:hypothetical protein
VSVTVSAWGQVACVFGPWIGIGVVANVADARMEDRGGTLTMALIAGWAVYLIALFATDVLDWGLFFG